MGVWWSGAGETGGNITNVSPPDSGGSGNGNNQDDQNNQTGETGSSGHKLLDQYNQLVAEGKGGTTQAQNLGRYLGRVEQKYQSGAGPGGYEGESLFNDLSPSEQHVSELEKKYKLDPQAAAWESKSELEKIRTLAAMEADDPKYRESWEGQQMKAQGKGPGTKEWIDRFGMPSIVAMPTYYQGDYEYEKGREQTWDKDPIMTKVGTDEFGQELGGEYIYSELGQRLMDQYQGQEDFDYGMAKDAYWSDRAAQESQPEEGSWYTGHQSGGGYGGGGGGYYGDPRTGNPIDRYGNFYTPQANLQQAMVNVHGTPTVFKKRGGIVSLLGLGS